jgi:hypothetical protein
MIATAAAFAAAMAASHALASGSDQPVALAGLEPGQWDLRSHDPSDPSLRLCVKDMRDLLQVKHIGQSCSRYVVADGPDKTSVTYDCPRTGHGRTDLRVETSRLVQISSQGVADGFPFALSLEGRRTGECRSLQSKPYAGSSNRSSNRPRLSIAPR